MKRSMLFSTAIAALALAAVMYFGYSSQPARADATSGEELSMYMEHMRRQTHKLGLSIDAKNKDLSAFYAKELGELAGLVSTKFPMYDDIQVGVLIKAMLDPYMGPLNTALTGGDWAAADAAYNTLVTSGCNGCHTATQRQFIKVTTSKTNAYNQDFTP